ncbi:MAG: uracil phosphoribosyltransferase, partial [Actinomycetota bacterium]
MPVDVHVVEHPLIADSLTRIRDRNTPNALFRQELERVGTLLLAEATRVLPTKDVRVQTPLVETGGKVLASQPVVVPVLRAGLGFVHAAQELMPNADV